MQESAATHDAVQEITDLWTRLYGEPPPIRAELSLMVRVLVETLPEPGGVEPRGCG